ncbi:MAG: enoyl-CoA hydratase-related protein [Nevskiales bacterium]|nr:enoyl-CoA hydratase-related protein [Nevskiales bacterium]
MNTDIPSFETVRIELDGPIGILHMARPDRANAMNLPMWDEFPKALAWMSAQPSLRAAILCGDGKHFCAGIDLSILQWLDGVVSDPQACPSRAREKVHAFIEHAQAALNACEQLRVPLIAAVHGACVGAGVDMIGACDIRIATRDARFCIKEVDMAVVPDVGTLQRLRHVIGYSATAELSLTGETFDGDKALALGLVSRVCADREELLATARQLAHTIAAKPPTTVRGIKRNLLWARDHDVRDGLAYTAAWNAGMLMGHDIREAVSAQMEKRAPKYSD